MPLFLDNRQHLRGFPIYLVVFTLILELYSGYPQFVHQLKDLIYQLIAIKTPSHWHYCITK